jgi:sortase A
MTAPTTLTTAVDEVDVVDMPDSTEQIPRVESSEPGPADKPGRVPASIARRGVQVFLLVVAAFIVFALWLSGLVQARSQIGLQHQFRTELESNLAPIGGAIPKGAPVAVVQSDAIGLDQVVVEGSRSTQLREGPGHVIGSPLPGQPGNAVIAGRHTLYGGAFRHIGSLHPGNRIRVTTGEGVSDYIVTDVRRLSPGDGSFVQNQGDNRLTLFTSASSWSTDGRLVVSAKLNGKPYAPTDLQHSLDADGLGLTGERDAAPNFLVWLELLACAALVTAFLASRWSRTRVWLVCAPVVALLLWCFFESATRLLPATL